MGDRVLPVDVSTVQERVYLEVQAALHQGRFMPGEAVTIRSLAQAVGTSPMPIRGAIQRLVAEKALVQLPNRTFRVAPFDLDIHAEQTRIRCAVEGFAAYRAAIRAPAGLVDELRDANGTMERAPIGALSMSLAYAHWPAFTPPRWPGIRPALTPEAGELSRPASSRHRRALSSIVITDHKSGRGLRGAVAAGDTDGVLDANRQFHFALYRGAESSQLTEMITQFWLRSGPFIAMALRTPESRTMFEAGTRLHDRIIDAIGKQDPDGARFALALDIRAAAAWFRRRYRSEQSDPGEGSPAA